MVHLSSSTMITQCFFMLKIQQSLRNGAYFLRFGIFLRNVSIDTSFRGIVLPTVSYRGFYSVYYYSLESFRLKSERSLPNCVNPQQLYSNALLLIPDTSRDGIGHCTNKDHFKDQSSILFHCSFRN